MEEWKRVYGKNNDREILSRAYITINSHARSLEVHPDYVLRALEGLTLKLDPTWPESEPGDLVYGGDYPDIIKSGSPDTYRVRRKDFFDAVEKNSSEAASYFEKFFEPDITVIVFKKDAVYSIVD